jgi:hypothetical protein
MSQAFLMVLKDAHFGRGIVFLQIAPLSRTDPSQLAIAILMQ